MNKANKDTASRGFIQQTDSAGIAAPVGIDDLSHAFKAFSEGATKMKSMYSKLERRVSYLTGELDKKNKELERVNRLAALGELAAGLAHEIRNPLGGIELCATILQRQLDSDTNNRDLIGHVVDGVRRLNTLVVNLLSFTRDMRIVSREFDVITLLEESLGAVLMQAKRNRIAVVKDVKVGECIIRADSTQLRQVFINIMLNAIEAMACGGTLTIQLSVISASSQRQESIMISFGDTGPGIKGDLMGKIFNPFFTTKDEGTGLGLALSHKIIESHNGAISVESKEGEGTTFIITIPIDREKV